MPVLRDPPRSSCLKITIFIFFIILLSVSIPGLIIAASSNSAVVIIDSISTENREIRYGAWMVGLLHLLLSLFFILIAYFNKARNLFELLLMIFVALALYVSIGGGIKDASGYLFIKIFNECTSSLHNLYPTDCFCGSKSFESKTGIAGISVNINIPADSCSYVVSTYPTLLMLSSFTCFISFALDCVLVILLTVKLFLCRGLGHMAVNTSSTSNATQQFEMQSTPLMTGLNEQSESVPFRKSE